MLAPSASFLRRGRGLRVYNVNDSLYLLGFRVFHVAQVVNQTPSGVRETPDHQVNEEVEQNHEEAGKGGRPGVLPVQNTVDEVAIVSVNSRNREEKNIVDIKQDHFKTRNFTQFY